MTPNALAKTTQDITREQRKVETVDGAYDAYLSAPATGTATGPGVIMVTSIFGIDQDMKNFCEDLASRGCVALAPNFFWRDETPGPLSEAVVQQAIGRAMRTDFGKSMEDVKRGIEELRRHPACNGKVVLFGFCYGGPHAWRAACDGVAVDATISFHGTMVSKAMKPQDKPRCPVAFYYGEHDELAPPPELEAVRTLAEANGCEFKVIPGAGHAYMMASNSHYDAAATEATWNAALELLATLK